MGNWSTAANGNSFKRLNLGLWTVSSQARDDPGGGKLSAMKRAGEGKKEGRLTSEKGRTCGWLQDGRSGREGCFAIILRLALQKERRRRRGKGGGLRLA